MLHESIRLSYPWIKSTNQINELLHKLAFAEDQEEAELFLFRLYYENETDLQFFGPEEKERVKGFLRLLMDDTHRHKELIAEIKDELQAVAEVANGS